MPSLNPNTGPVSESTSSSIRRNFPLLRRVVLSAAVGFSLGWVGKLLPLPWGLYWDGAICLAGIAASVYMAWDMRRMERERLKMQAELRCILDKLLPEAEKAFTMAAEVEAGRQELIRKVEELRGERWVN